jgi:type 1 fimbria pilin
MIKKVIQLFFLTSGILSAHYSYAECNLYKKVDDSYILSNRWTGDTYVYNMPAIIRVKPTDQIGQILAESQGYYISQRNSTDYINCDSTDLVLNAITRQITTDGIIPTAVKGIGYRIIYNNEKYLTRAEQNLFLFSATAPNSMTEVVRQPEKFKIQLIKTGDYEASGYVGGANTGVVDSLFSIMNGQQNNDTSYKEVGYGHTTATYITMTTCSLFNNNIIVNLPAVPKNFFKKVGTVVAAQPFSIKFGCTKDDKPADTELSAISFSFLSEIGTTNVISNTSSGNKATGIGMNLLLDDKVVENGKKYEISGITSGGSFTAQLNMKAQYIQINEEVTPGDVQGIVTIILTFI